MVLWLNFFRMELQQFRYSLRPPLRSIVQLSNLSQFVSFSYDLIFWESWCQLYLFFIQPPPPPINNVHVYILCFSASPSVEVRRDDEPVSPAPKPSTPRTGCNLRFLNVVVVKCSFHPSIHLSTDPSVIYFSCVKQHIKAKCKDVVGSYG